MPRILSSSSTGSRSSIPEASKNALMRSSGSTEGKEWFRCSFEVAIDAVRKAADIGHSEKFSRTEMDERLAHARQAARLRLQAEQQVSEQAAAEPASKERRKADVERRYRPELERLSSMPHTRTLTVWLGAIAVILLISAFVAPSPVVFVIQCLIVAAIVGSLLPGAVDRCKKNEITYQSMKARYEDELRAIEGK